KLSGFECSVGSENCVFERTVGLKSGGNKISLVLKNSIAKISGRSKPGAAKIDTVSESRIRKVHIRPEGNVLLLYFGRKPNPSEIVISVVESLLEHPVEVYDLFLARIVKHAISLALAFSVE